MSIPFPWLGNLTERRWQKSKGRRRLAVTIPVGAINWHNMSVAGLAPERPRTPRTAATSLAQRSTASTDGAQSRSVLRRDARRVPTLKPCVLDVLILDYQRLVRAGPGVRHRLWSMTVVSGAITGDQGPPGWRVRNYPDGRSLPARVAVQVHTPLGGTSEPRSVSPPARSRSAFGLLGSRVHDQACDVDEGDPDRGEERQPSPSAHRDGCQDEAGAERHRAGH